VCLRLKQIQIEKKLSEEEQQEIRRPIEEKYNPSTIFRTYPGTIYQSYRAGWDKIAEQTINVYWKALARRVASGPSR
jgi:hypothetical protein